MDISDLTIPLLPVAGYPQIRVIAPTIADLAEAEERSNKLQEAAGDRDAMAKMSLWFFNKHVRDADGNAISGIKSVKDAREKIPTSLLRAAMDAVTRGAGALESDSPTEDAPAS